MIKQRSEYKEQAKKMMDQKYGTVIPVLLIFGLISGAVNGAIERTTGKFDWKTFQQVSEGYPLATSILNLVSLIITAIVAYAMVKMFIAITSEKTVKVEDVVLSGFTDNFIRNVVLQFLINLFVTLWTLLFIIPGIVKSYAYSMSFYLINKSKDLGAVEAIDQSKKMTKGYKADLFFLDLSYLGWYILGLFTLGILWLWIVPKHQTARVLYFNEIFEKFHPVKKDPEMSLES